jgi:hypothetical protein
MRAGLAKFQMDYIPYRAQRWKMSHSDKLLVDTKDALEHVYGPCVATHVLPHFQRPDLILCFDDKMKPVTSDFSNFLSSGHTGVILSKNLVLNSLPDLAQKHRKVHFVAVVVGGWNFYIRDTEIPTGNLKMKLEQLDMCGFTPLLIHWETWTKTPIEQRTIFLKTEMAKVLSS